MRDDWKNDVGRSHPEALKKNQLTDDKIPEKLWDQIAEQKYCLDEIRHELEIEVDTLQGKYKHLLDYIKSSTEVIGSYNDDGKEHALHDLCTIVPEKLLAEIDRLKRELWTDEDMFDAACHGRTAYGISGVDENAFKIWISARRAAKAKERTDE